MNTRNAKDLGGIILTVGFYLIAAPLFAGIVVGWLLPGIPFFIALCLTWAAMFKLMGD